MDDRHEWVRTRRGMPCPICNHVGWCLVHKDGNAIICPRVSDGSTKDLGEAGYLHHLENDGDRPIRAVVRARPQKKAPTIDAAAYSIRCWRDITQDEVDALADELSISPESLQLLRIGWCRRLGVYTFPMRDGDRNVVGVRTRCPITGEKKAVAGSRAGLFIPCKLKKKTLYVCEGPTDTAAMLSLGLMAIGRASCRGGVDHVRQFALANNYGAMVIMADNDKPDRDGRRPGFDGAVSLIEELMPWAEKTGRSIRLGYTQGMYKDVRDQVTSRLEDLRAQESQLHREDSGILKASRVVSRCR